MPGYDPTIPWRPLEVSQFLGIGQVDLANCIRTGSYVASSKALVIADAERRFVQSRSNGFLILNEEGTALFSAATKVVRTYVDEVSKILFKDWRTLWRAIHVDEGCQWTGIPEIPEDVTAESMLNAIAEISTQPALRPGAPLEARLHADEKLCRMFSNRDTIALNALIANEPELKGSFRRASRTRIRDIVKNFLVLEKIRNTPLAVLDSGELWSLSFLIEDKRAFLWSFDLRSLEIHPQAAEAMARRRGRTASSVPTSFGSDSTPSPPEQKVHRWNNESTLGGGTTLGDANTTGYQPVTAPSVVSSQEPTGFIPPSVTVTSTVSSLPSSPHPHAFSPDTSSVVSNNVQIPVAFHASPSQIPGMQSSTSSIQGHDVDEPQGLAVAIARSIRDLSSDEKHSVTCGVCQQSAPLEPPHVACSVCAAVLHVHCAATMGRYGHVRCPTCRSNDPSIPGGTTLRAVMFVGSIPSTVMGERVTPGWTQFVPPAPVDQTQAIVASTPPEVTHVAPVTTSDPTTVSTVVAEDAPLTFGTGDPLVTPPPPVETATVTTNLPPEEVFSLSVDDIRCAETCDIKGGPSEESAIRIFMNLGPEARTLLLEEEVTDRAAFLWLLDKGWISRIDAESVDLPDSAQEDHDYGQLQEWATSFGLSGAVPLG